MTESAVTVLIPTLLRRFVDRRSEVSVRVSGPTTVDELLDTVGDGRPLLGQRIRDETGTLRRYVNIYVDGEDVRGLNLLDTPVNPGATVTIIQSVAGG
ncbi:MoaD/ThiS family protein [Arthrobacter sp. Br18]|uniref:MoaD/ThiS family protein n=1 Tax=Arthrobacter sp. Br18 TaxID=1312954 RepID=UPI00047C2F4F|nr:MoaD/ThiS family protein [Arthrobacter sp. Br18]